MDAVQPTPSQKNAFLKSIKKLDILNNLFADVDGKFKAYLLSINWFNDKTGANISAFNDEVGSIQNRLKKLTQLIANINYSYTLLRAKKAFLIPSDKYKNDFDIGTMLDAKSSEVKNALINRSNLGVAFIVPFIPLIIKGTVVLGTSIIAYGITDAITQTIIDAKKIDSEIVRIQSNHESLMSKDPSIFKQWIKHKNDLIKNNIIKSTDWFSGITQKATGGLIAIALVAIAGVILFKYLGKSNDNT